MQTYFHPGVKWSKKIFVSSRVETHVWHQFFSARVEIENFTPGRNFTSVGALTHLLIRTLLQDYLWNELTYFRTNERNLQLRKKLWLLRLKLIQLEQQKTQLPFIILAKKLKPILCKVIQIFELEINNLRVQILAAKIT